MFLYDFVLLLSAIVFGVIALNWVRQPAATVFHPLTFYLAFHGLIFVIRPIMSRIFDYRFVYMLYDFEPAIEDRIVVIIAANLGLIVFGATCWRLARFPIVFAQDRFDRMQRQMLIKPFLAMTAMLAPIALYSIIETWLSSAAGVTTMVIDSETGVRVNTSSTGYFIDLQLMLATISVLFAWLFRFRLFSLVPFLLFFILRAGTGGRGPIIFATALMILLFLYDQRRRWPEWRSALLTALALVAFVGVVQDRGAAVRSLFITDQTEAFDSGYEMAPMEDMDFANMEYFEYLVWAIPERTRSYDYGASLLQLFTEPVPRTLWPGKPIGSPVKFFNLFDYGNPVGMTFSLPGYGWFEFGWIGVVVLCAAFGALYAEVYNIAVRRRESNFSILIAFALISMTVVSYRDGSIVSIAKMSLFYLTPIAVMYAMAKIVGVPSAAEMRHLAAGRTSRSKGARPTPANATSEHETPAQRRRRLAAALVRRPG